MAAVTTCSDFGAPQNKVCHCFHCFPIYLSWSDGTRCLDFSFCLCDPMDCSLPGSSINGIFPATVLEWVAISFSRGSSQPRDRTQVSHIVGRRFTIWATRQAPSLYLKDINLLALLSRTNNAECNSSKWFGMCINVETVTNFLFLVSKILQMVPQPWN